MSPNPNVAEVAALLADSSRAKILISLMDGRFHTASELAYMAGITPQTASFHLAKLTLGNLVVVEKHGRYRYYQIFSHEVAQILESLLTISPPVEIKSFKQSSQMKKICYARTCYDHLAGKLGVRLTQSILDSGFIERKESDFLVTSHGEHFFKDLGLDLPALRKQRRSFSRACLDWSE
jgi:DNA-binding transcriptional ArsR family regulator